MNWLDKLLIFLASLVLAVIGIISLLIGFGVDFLDSFTSLLSYMSTSSGIIASIIIGAILTITAFYLAGRWLGRNEEEVGITAESEFGRVNISEKVIKAYADRAARSIEGIVNVKSAIKAREDGLHIFLDLVTKSNIKTAETAKAVQERVQEFVTDSIGTKVTSVEVKISGVESESKPRVS